MNKRLGCILLCAGVAGSAVGVTISLVAMRDLDAKTAKASKLDEVCALTRSALRVDRELLKSQRDRELTLANFAGNRIGDGYQMLEWCVPRVRESVDAVRACRQLDGQAGYDCASRVLETMERSIER